MIILVTTLSGLSLLMLQLLVYDSLLMYRAMCLAFNCLDHPTKVFADVYNHSVSFGATRTGLDGPVGEGVPPTAVHPCSGYEY